jgi:ABC-type sugar transport system permease subunit
MVRITVPAIRPVSVLTVAFMISAFGLISILTGAGYDRSGSKTIT